MTSALALSEEYQMFSAMPTTTSSLRVLGENRSKTYRQWQNIVTGDRPRFAEVKSCGHYLHVDCYKDYHQLSEVL